MNSPEKSTSQASRPIRPLPNLIFMSRWLQLPLYIGLILAQCVYVYHFWVELIDLIGAADPGRGPRRRRAQKAWPKEKIPSGST